MNQKYFSDSFLSSVLKAWGIDSEITFIRYLENYVYDIKVAKKILRLTRADRKNITQINEELLFIQHLKECGANVCFPIESCKKKLIHTFEYENKTYSACVFNKAEGDRLSLSSPSLQKGLELLGEQFALLHKHGKGVQYEARPDWSSDKLYKRADAALKGPRYKFEYEKFLSLTDEIQSLSDDSNLTGVIHGDCHFGNFFFSENKVEIFDFDDSHQGFLTYDIVIPFWGIILEKATNPDLIVNLPENWVAFKTKYTEAYQKSDLFSPELFDLFFKFRCLMSLGWSIELKDDKSLTEQVRRWCINNIETSQTLLALESPFKSFLS